MQNRTKEKLVKELLDFQRRIEALKSSYDITVNELNKAKKWSETLLSSLPHPAMYIRAKDRVIVSVNRIASDMGVKVGGYCWREFMKAEYLSQKDKEIAAKYPNAVPSEFEIKCSFCLSDKCFSDSHAQIDHEMHALGLIWETYWIKVSDEIYLHYAINITERKHAEMELLESENRNREIIDNTSAGYFYINREGFFQKVNSTWLRLHKYVNADEVIGKHFGITQVDTDLENAKKIVEEIFKGDQIPSGDFSRLCKDGSIGYHTFSCNKVIKDGKVIGLEGFLIDNTDRKQAEMTLRESEKKYRLVVENVGEGIGFVNTDEEFVVVNSAAERIFGVGKGELLGRNLKGFLSEEQYLAILSQTKIRKKGQESTYEFELTRPNGEKRSIFIIAVPQFDDSNKFIGTHGIFRDITEQKKAEQALMESNIKFLSLANNISGYIAYVNADTLQYEFVNDLYKKSFGIPEEKIIGSHIKDVIGEANYQFALKYINEVKSGKSVFYENTFDFASGKRWIQTNYAPVTDSTGHITSIAVLSFDITESKQVQQALKNNERKLYQLNTDKDRFISILGHDLKNPFGNILGFSELLTDEIESLNKEEIEDIAKNINKSAKITYNLLEEILLWAKTQQGKIPFKPQILSFKDICKDTLEILISNANAKNISLNCSSSEQINVFADNEMLKTVLRNLVSNAIKFTKTGGAIIINAEVNPDNVTISVSDNGNGIPPENLAKLFNISEVLTTKGTAGETGTGLGLLLCKDFVEKLGGKIWVESESGKGSRFSFTMPNNYKPKEINDI